VTILITGAAGFVGCKMDYLSGSNWKEKVKLIICGPGASTLEVSGLLNHETVIYPGEVKPEEPSEIARASDLGLWPLENSSFNQTRFPIKFFD